MVEISSLFLKKIIVLTAKSHYSSTWKFIKIFATFQVNNRLPPRERARFRGLPTLCGPGEELPIQQPLQEHGSSMKMLQEHGDRRGRVCPGPWAGMGQQAALWCSSREPHSSTHQRRCKPNSGNPDPGTKKLCCAGTALYNQLKSQP